LGFLYETVQKNHLAVHDTEYDSGYAATRQVAVDFPKTLAQRAYQF
jgi:hypothetical protein